MAGKFIVLEGLDGSGITTQAALLKATLAERGIPAHVTKEPTDGPIGSQIRLVLAKRLSRPHPETGEALPLDEETMALLFAADRMDHLHTKILPWLAEGAVVISDRYVLSSLAYQSTAADLNWIRAINSRARRPDLTVLISVPPEEAQRRIHTSRWHVELYEQLPKLRQVYANFHALAKEMQAQGEPVLVVDGTQSVESVRTAIAEAVLRMLS